MNRKQIICMWLGIAAFELVGLGAAMQGEIYLWMGKGRGAPGGDLVFPHLFVLWLCIIVITSGLIYTFRDRKTKLTKND